MCNESVLKTPKAMFTVVCCVCGDVIESKPGPLGMISHGYCLGCYEEAMADAGRDRSTTLLGLRDGQKTTGGR